MWHELTCEFENEMRQYLQNARFDAIKNYEIYVPSDTMLIHLRCVAHLCCRNTIELWKQLKRSKQENIFPSSFINPICKIAVEWHSVKVGLLFFIVHARS